jgi:hypothetical protein
MQGLDFLRKIYQAREVELFGIKLYACPRNLSILLNAAVSLIGLLIAWIYWVEPELSSPRPVQYIFNVFNCSFVIFFLFIAYIQL